MGGGEIAEGDGSGATGEDGTERVGGLRGEEMLERIVGRALGIVSAEKTGDGVGNFLGAAAIAYGTGDGSELANGSANAEIVGVNEFAIELDFFCLRCRCQRSSAGRNCWGSR